MYEIRPETVKSFITDRNVRLPRFQRKQTWDPKKNFQLCISLFKEYPIGVCILSVDESKGKTVRWLLDGRQRKNALTKMYEDPENIYNWARAFIGFKNSDQPFELEEKYWEKINEYIEADVDEEYGNTSEGEDDSLPAESEEDVVIRDSSSGLELLLDIIKIIHNKQKKNTGFTKPFDFTKYVDRLPYMENGENALSSRKLKMFIDEYRNHADAYRQDYEDEDCFYEYLDSRSIVKDEKKTKQLIHDKWDEILERMLIIDKIDSQLTSSKIGMIEVKNLSPSDSQKIFKKTKTFPVFINYDKEENISDTTKYEDHFIPGFRDRLIAISKSGRSLQSEDVQNFLKAKERGIQVELFVRKNKDDKISKEFYYLGHMTASGKTKEFKMANTEKTAVEIEWILDVPVREDIYEYIVNS